jgi:hypothetical protein
MRMALLSLRVGIASVEPTGAPTGPHLAERRGSAAGRFYKRRPTFVA